MKKNGENWERDAKNCHFNGAASINKKSLHFVSSSSLQYISLLYVRTCTVCVGKNRFLWNFCCFFCAVKVTLSAHFGYFSVIQFSQWGFHCLNIVHLCNCLMHFSAALHSQISNFSARLWSLHDGAVRQNIMKNISKRDIKTHIICIEFKSASQADGTVRRWSCAICRRFLTIQYIIFLKSSLETISICERAREWASCLSLNVQQNGSNVA